MFILVVDLLLTSGVVEWYDTIRNFLLWLVFYLLIVW